MGWVERLFRCRCCVVRKSHRGGAQRTEGCVSVIVCYCMQCAVALFNHTQCVLDKSFSNKLQSLTNQQVMVAVDSVVQITEMAKCVCAFVFFHLFCSTKSYCSLSLLLSWLYNFSESIQVCDHGVFELRSVFVNCNYSITIIIVTDGSTFLEGGKVCRGIRL